MCRGYLHLFGGAHIEHFVRYARLDEDKIARFVFDHIATARAIFMPDTPLQDIEHNLEVHMDMGIRHATGGNRSHIHRERSGVDIFGRQASLVEDVVPITPRPTPADDGDAVLAFDTSLQISIGLVHRCFSFQPPQWYCLGDHAFRGAHAGHIHRRLVL